MNNLSEQITKARNALLENKYFHLPLPYRVKLMRALQNNNLQNKIFLECAKKVYSFWHQKYPNDASVYLLIKNSQDFLYKNNKTNFIKEADAVKGYFEAIKDKEASFSAHCALSLCYSIAYNASGILNIEDYNGEDDDSFDWETWNSDFWASMAYCGGNPFLNEGVRTLRKEFWLWYLNTITKLSNNSSSPLIDLPRETTAVQNAFISTRNQSYLKEEITSKIKSIIEYTIQDLKKQYNTKVWSEIMIEGTCMSAGTNLKASFIETGKTESTPIKLSYYLYSGDKSSANLLNQIKKSMYSQVPKEGAWLNMSLWVSSNLAYKIKFNYDDEKLIPANRQSPDYLEMEFKDFPRSKSFTPKWWQNIVENKVPFIA